MDVFFENHVGKCVEQHKKDMANRLLGNADYSRLNDKAKSMDGMIQEPARNLLNLIANFEGCRYLQIGTWKGACLYSALYGNNVEYAFACDNFSQYAINQGASFVSNGKMKTHINLNTDVMLGLMQPEQEGESVEFQFYDGDCFGMPLNKIEKPINMYFYDGGHNVGDHFLALYYYYPVLADEFIFICDDWPEEKVRTGTRAAIEQCNYAVRAEWTEENMFIAHLGKNKFFGQRLAEARMTNTQPMLCRLNSKEVIKETVNR